MNFRFNKKKPINATTGQLYPFKKIFVLPPQFLKFYIIIFLLEIFAYPKAIFFTKFSNFRWKQAFTFFSYFYKLFNIFLKRYQKVPKLMTFRDSQNLQALLLNPVTRKKLTPYCKLASRQTIDLVKQNLLSIETAAQCAKMTVNEFQIVLKKQNSQQQPIGTGMRHYSAAFSRPQWLRFYLHFFTVPLLLLLRSLR